EVITHLAVADRDHRPPARELEELQETRVAGSVHRRRPQHRDLDAVSSAELEREALSVRLGPLVDADGPDRMGFVGRRSVDAAVDAARAAVHDAPDAVA